MRNLGDGVISSITLKGVAFFKISFLKKGLGKSSEFFFHPQNTKY
jgi:hypothetical protein